MRSLPVLQQGAAESAKHVRVHETPIPGCFELRPLPFDDERGRFVKTFTAVAFSQMGLRCDWVEQYHSVSEHGVVRGLHCQLPPHQHAKLVYCPIGEVCDVVLDLRIGSPAYGAWFSVQLSSSVANAMYIPSGVAHGFQVISEQALMIYNVTSAYAPAHDFGIRWDTAGVAWPASSRPVSARDRGLPSLGEFESPFLYDPDKASQ